MKNGRALWLVMALALLLSACGRSTVVRRERGHEPQRHSQARIVRGAREYVVARGDTLYGIAFRHGLDYRDVAAWNRIAPPYTIYPGQRIRLVASVAPAASRPNRPAATASRPAAPAAVSPRNTAPRSTPPHGSTASRQPAPPAAAPKPQAPVATGPVRWQWPTAGQIIGRYVAGDPTRQGVDIAGSGGQAVSAAADGVVVYSGAGLVGYGELVIVKHTDEWLSAYGHNRRRLVEEGQQVRAGQQIAEMGRTGASRDMLHFEIRRNGRPVDPLQHLPPR